MHVARACTTVNVYYRQEASGVTNGVNKYSQQTIPGPNILFVEICFLAKACNFSEYPLICVGLVPRGQGQARVVQVGRRQGRLGYQALTHRAVNATTASAQHRFLQLQQQPEACRYIQQKFVQYPARSHDRAWSSIASWQRQGPMHPFLNTICYFSGPGVLG